MIDREGANTILSNEYNKVSSDQGFPSQAVDHDIVTVGQQETIDNSSYHSAVKEEAKNTYTHKNDVIGVKRKQSISQVTNYNHTGKVGTVSVEQASRNYYKRK